MVKSFDVRKYVIPLARDVMVAPKHKHAKRSVLTVRKFVKKNTRAENIHIGEELNKKLWANSIERPPRKVSVFVQKLSDGSVFVNLEGSPLRIEKKPEEKTKAAAPKETEKPAEEKKEEPEKKTAKKAKAKLSKK